MLKYIIKRILLSIVILIGVSLIIYILVRCMPFNYVEQKASQMQDQGLSKEVLDNMLKMYELEDDSFGGIIKGYFTWLGNLARFDLGQSFKFGGAPVLQVIVRNMGVSFAVSFIGIIFEYLIAIPLGITAATHQYSIRDYVVTVIVMVGIALPSFFFARLLQMLFSSELGWFPNSTLISEGKLTGFARFGDIVWHLVLPLATVIFLGIGGTMRYTRTNMLEVLNADYIRTARAKGLSEGRVIYKHAFRNTMIPLVTMLAGILPGLFSGALITEQIFDLPGIGNAALQATQAVDIPFIMSYNMFIAFLSVIGVLLSDLMYMVVDPRVKLS